MIGLTPGFTGSNSAGGQNFISSFTLASATTLTGASIYSDCINFGCGPTPGTGVVIKFRSDIAGVPGSVNLFDFNTVVNAVDSSGSSANPSIQRIFATFAPTTFAAGTYWFGMTGVAEIGLSLANPSSSEVWVLAGDTLQVSLPYALAFQLESTVPEPASWALMIGGFAVTGLTMRRRKIPLAA